MPNGVDGWGGYYLSAYGLAVKHGFHGSETDWLEYLRAGEVQLRLEDGQLFWKTDKTEDWTELPEYSAIHQDLIQIQTTAEEIVAKSENALDAAIAGAEQCQKDCAEKCNTMLSETQQSMKDWQEDTAQQYSAVFGEFQQKVNTAEEEVARLSEECKEIQATNEQSNATAERLSKAITVSRTTISSGVDPLESGCLYIVY